MAAVTIAQQILRMLRCQSKRFDNPAERSIAMRDERHLTWAVDQLIKSGDIVAGDDSRPPERADLSPTPPVAGDALPEQLVTLINDNFREPFITTGLVEAHIDSEGGFCLRVGSRDLHVELEGRCSFIGSGSSVGEGHVEVPVRCLSSNLRSEPDEPE